MLKNEGGKKQKATRGRSMEERPTQSRERGQGENFPLQDQGTASLVGFGATPQLFPRQTYSKEAANKGAGSEASLPVTLRVLRRAPKLLIRPTVLCRAKWARPNCLPFRHSWSFPQAGDFAPAGASRGLCGRPRHPFAVHTHVSWSLSWQGISPLRRRPKGMKTDECLRSPPTPLRSAHLCGLIFIVAGGIAPAGATRGLSGRPLDPFGRHYRNEF